MKKTKRKGFNFYRSYYDVFNELKDDDKLKFIKALLDKQFLDIEPDKLVGMVNFAWISQYNSIDQQVKGYKSKTKDPMQGGCQGEAIRGVVTPSLQEKEKEKEKEKEENKKKVFNFRKEILDLGGDKDLVEDWLKVRKTKKATNTKTALNGFMSQVGKSNKTINEVLNICVVNSWSSFNHSWRTSIDNKPRNNKPKLTF